MERIIHTARHNITHTVGHAIIHKLYGKKTEFLPGGLESLNINLPPSLASTYLEPTSSTPTLASDQPQEYIDFAPGWEDKLAASLDFVGGALIIELVHVTGEYHWREPDRGIQSATLDESWIAIIDKNGNLHGRLVQDGEIAQVGMIQETGYPSGEMKRIAFSDNIPLHDAVMAYAHSRGDTSTATTKMTLDSANSPFGNQAASDPCEPVARTCTIGDIIMAMILRLRLGKFTLKAYSYGFWLKWDERNKTIYPGIPHVVGTYNSSLKPLIRPHWDGNLAKAGGTEVALEAHTRDVSQSLGCILKDRGGSLY